jgi:hypothetical protein
MARKKAPEPIVQQQPVVAPIDIQARFRKANIYNALLSTTLVEGDGPDESIVENEIKQFIQQRMEVLMGARLDPTQDEQWVGVLSEVRDEIKRIQTGGFSKEQLMILQRLAEKILSQSANPAPTQAYAPAINQPMQNQSLFQPSTGVSVPPPAPLSAHELKSRAGYVPTTKAAQIIQQAEFLGEEVPEEAKNAVQVARGRSVRVPPNAPQPIPRLTEAEEEHSALQQGAAAEKAGFQIINLRMKDPNAVASSTEGITD